MAAIASSAMRYRSACASSSVMGISPRLIRRASPVPSSTISAYAETWSGPAPIAASRDARQSSSDSPGVP